MFDMKTVKKTEKKMKRVLSKKQRAKMTLRQNMLWYQVILLNWEVENE